VATLLIIGASREIGLETVKAALQAAHSVRALARPARRIPVDHPKLEKMAGDALETATVKRALTGVDVVTQSLGVSAGPEIILKPTRLFSKATRVLVTAMEEAQVKRFICVTGFGAGDSRGRRWAPRRSRRSHRAGSFHFGARPGTCFGLHGDRSHEACSDRPWAAGNNRFYAAGVFC
jgi:uncharacterized protein YbjT (DUF2867 family)